MQHTLAEEIDSIYARLEQHLFAIAEEMPESAFAFAPVDEVRTFGEQLRHIGAVQWVVGCSLLGEKVPVDVGDGDSGPTSMTGKAAILDYARESFVRMRQAVRIINAENALELVPHPYDPEHFRFTRIALLVGYAAHGWEHYGQMVVYQRMNGIVPAPTRGQQL